MAYVVKNTRGQTVATVLTGTTDTTSTDVTLIGQNVVEYGLDQNENFVYILENFANTTPPLYPIQGQIWFDTGTNTINYRDVANTWTSVASQSYVQAQKISPAFTGVPTAPTAANGVQTTQIATTAYAQNMDLGWGQTYTNVTSSRALSTTYTNSTGKPIFCNLVINTSGSGSYGVVVGGVTVYSVGSYSGGSVPVSFVVPSGATYSATGTALVSWVELR